MKEHDLPSCKSCEFYIFGWANTYECRRYPPLDNNGAWPPVRENDWCGEWKESTTVYAKGEENKDDTTRITLPKKEGRPPYHCKPVEELITEDDVIKAIAYDENSQNPKEVNIPIVSGPPADFVTAVVGKHDIENEPLIDVKNKGEVIMSIDWSIKCTKCKKVFDNSNDMLVNISVLCPECMPKKGD